MSFGFGVGDIMTISKLAVKVYTAYKDAPEDYKHIAEEVDSLQSTINHAVKHFESTTLSDNDRLEGQKVLKGCQSVLGDLNSLIEKYNSLASANTTQVFKRVKLGTEDIATLRARLGTNATLLSSFIRSCEYLEIQARLTDVLGLHRTTSRTSIDSITSFAGSINTKKAFKTFCKDLYESGVTAEVINQKRDEILNILKPQNKAIGDQVDDSNNADDSQLPANRSRFQSPMEFFFGPLLLSAATAGNTKRFISYLKYMRNINFQDDLEDTALHKAAGAGHKDIAQLILGKGASIGVKNKFHNTPLHLAAWNGHTSTVELFLEKGASVETKGYLNETPLHLTARFNQPRTAQLLLEKGASIGAINEHNNSPLHLAALAGQTDMVGLLLKNGASIEAGGYYNYTPLHLAVWNGHTSTVELLLEKSASAETKGYRDETSLHLTARFNRPRIAQLLLEKGASVGAINKYNNSPLHLAALEGQTNMVGLLLKNGASIEARGYYNHTPLHRAVMYGRTNTVELLLKKGASIEVIGESARTPLDDAVLLGHTDIVQLLKSKAAAYGNNA